MTKERFDIHQHVTDKIVSAEAVSNLGVVQESESLLRRGTTMKWH